MTTLKIGAILKSPPKKINLLKPPNPSPAHTLIKLPKIKTTQRSPSAETNEKKHIMSDRFALFSAGFHGRWRGSSWLVSKSLNEAWVPFFTDVAGRLCIYVEQPDCFCGSSRFNWMVMGRGCPKTFFRGVWKSLNCVLYDESVDSLAHAFFRCKVVFTLCIFIEDMLPGKFFVLEACSVCSNVVSFLTNAEHYVVLGLLSVMCVVISESIIWRREVYLLPVDLVLWAST